MGVISSFDVFDTVVTRRVGCPKTVFYLTGKEAVTLDLWKGTPESFALQRIEAEIVARRHALGGEPTLNEIYSELSWTFGISSDATAEIRDIELNIERRSIIAIEPHRKLVAETRARGERIIFVSDMYLPSEFILSILKSLHIAKQTDLCFVSCEIRTSKANGAFKLLCERLGVAACDITHIGNNYQCDFTAARKAGLQAKFLEAGNLNRYEQQLVTFASQTDGFSSILAATSRRVRIGIPTNDKQEIVVRDTAASVAAPILLCYVSWLLEEAKRRGIAKLYFLSRDGQVLLEIAKILLKEHPNGISCEYLHGSRLAWQSTGIPNFSNSEEKGWAFENAANLTVREFLSKFSVKPEELSEELLIIGFSAASWDETLTHKKVRIFAKITEFPRFESLVATSAEKNRQAMLEYFRQRGVTTPGAWGVVDVGWRGTCLLSLARALKMEAVEPPVGFYFGLYEHRHLAESVSAAAYLFDPVSGHGIGENLAADDMATFIELFCTADHGTVLGYSNAVSGNVFSPILRSPTNPEAEAWGLSIFRESVCEFSRIIAEEFPKYRHVNMRPALVDLIEMLTLRPSPVEAKIWGDIQFCTDETAGKTLRFAGELGVRSVWSALRFGNPTHNSARPQWRGGSLVNSSWGVRRSIAMVLRLRKLAKFFFCRIGLRREAAKR
jgi:predicted HAD superfamily hydrolase